jgi:hypothetical protein
VRKLSTEEVSSVVKNNSEGRSGGNSGYRRSKVNQMNNGDPASKTNDLPPEQHQIDTSAFE